MEKILEKVWISFQDEGREIKGYFDLVEQTDSYVKIQSKENIILIPYHRINKIKLKGGSKI